MAIVRKSLKANNSISFPGFITCSLLLKTLYWSSTELHFTRQHVSNLLAWKSMCSFQEEMVIWSWKNILWFPWWNQRLQIFSIPADMSCQVSHAKKKKTFNLLKRFWYCHYSWTSCCLWLTRIDIKLTIKIKKTLPDHTCCDSPRLRNIWTLT